jgi:hypothetical protein
LFYIIIILDFVFLHNVLYYERLTLYPSLADAGYLSTITVQHTIFNPRCNSASLECPYNIKKSAGTRPQPPPQRCNSGSLECPYNIQQSPGTRPQPPPQLQPRFFGKFEIQWRNVKFSVIKTITIYIYIYN